MAYATATDVADRLGRPLTDSEAARAPYLLDDAAALIDAYTGGRLASADVTPPVAGAVNANMVVRVFTAGAMPPGAESQQIGPFGIRFGAGTTSGGPWLSATDKAMLSAYRSGVSSVQLESERPTATGEVAYWRSL